MTVYIANPPETNLYTFPSCGNMASGWEGGMEVMSEDHPFRTDLTDKRYSPGGFVTGDCLSGSRNITVAGIIKGPSKREVTNYIDEMRNACSIGNYNHQQRYLKISQYPRQFYYISGVEKFSIDWITDVSAEIMVNFVIADPFRYDIYETDIPASGQPNLQAVLNSGNSYTATIDVTIPSNVSFIQIPEILITKYIGGMDQFWIWNLSAYRSDKNNPGMHFQGLQMTTTLATEYRNILIDSTAGTVSLCVSSLTGDVDYGSAINYIHKLNGGDFLWLQPGVNTLKMVASPIAANADIAIRLFIKTRYRYL